MSDAEKKLADARQNLGRWFTAFDPRPPFGKPDGTVSRGMLRAFEEFIDAKIKEAIEAGGDAAPVEIEAEEPSK